MSSTGFEYLDAAGLLSVTCPHCDEGEIRFAFPKQLGDELRCPVCRAAVAVYAVRASGTYRDPG